MGCAGHTRQVREVREEVGSLGRNKGLQSKSGFTLLEVLISAALLAVALLAVAAMFPTGYTSIADAGKMTMALTAARQILEDVGDLPFDRINNMNGFDTLNLATLPAGDPEQTIARRWRYALAGEGDGFTFTTTEKDEWSTLSTGNATLRARGQIGVAALSASLNQVTITITYPGQRPPVQLVTNISRL